jgi:hypothetical protein
VFTSAVTATRSLIRPATFTRNSIVAIGSRDLTANRGPGRSRETGHVIGGARIESHRNENKDALIGHRAALEGRAVRWIVD